MPKKQPQRPARESTAGTATLDHDDMANDTGPNDTTPNDIAPNDIDPNAETVVLPAVTGGEPARPLNGSSPRQVVVELPVGPEGGYVTRGFRRDLPMPQAQLCRRVINQLFADGVTLSSGRKIESPDDVLCYVMEQIERGITLNP